MFSFAKFYSWAPFEGSFEGSFEGLGFGVRVFCFAKRGLGL